MFLTMIYLIPLKFLAIKTSKSLTSAKGPLSEWVYFE